MKKIIIGIVIVLGIILAFFGFKAANGYYKSNYSGQIQYSKVSNQIPEKKQAKDSNGKKIDGVYEYDYTFKFIDEKGKEKTVDYSLSGEKVKPFTPNSYVKAEVGSARIVKGPNYVAKKDVPKSIINKLN